MKPVVQKQEMQFHTFEISDFEYSIYTQCHSKKDSRHLDDSDLIIDSKTYLSVIGHYIHEEEGDDAIWVGHEVRMHIYGRDYLPKTIGDARYDPTLYCDAIGSMQRKSAPLGSAHEGVCFVPMKAFDGIKELLFSGKGKYGQYLGIKAARRLLTNQLNVFSHLS